MRIFSGLSGLCVLILTGTLGAPGQASETTTTPESKREAEPADVAALTQTLEAERSAAAGISYPALRAEYQSPYLERPAFDAEAGAYYDGFVQAFGLNEEARARLSALGFVTVPAPGISEPVWDDEGEMTEGITAVGPTDVFYRVFAADLPVFISADAILHAWHRTFESMMMNLEHEVYFDDLRDILDATVARLSPDRQDERDALLYVTTARLLLDGFGVEMNGEDYEMWDWETGEEHPFSPHPAVAEKAKRLVRQIHRHRIRDVAFLGNRITMDFSQFIPRGYYTRSKRLTCYFLAMMWLGQTDLRLYDPKTEQVPSSREEAAARALTRALLSSDAVDLYRELDGFYTTVVGRGNALSPFGLGALCTASNAPDCRTRTPALTKGYAKNPPAYSSRVFDNERPPVALRFFPRRFAVDAWITAETSTPKLKPNVMGGRAMAMDMDVAFALGADRAVDHYEQEMKKPHRQHLPAALRALRKTLEAHPPTSIEKSVYNLWLEALSAVGAPTVDERFPQAMRTAAYHDKKLEALLASWTELRHDTLLTVEQSLGGSGCQYPKGYVEPLPALYRKLAEAAALTESAFGVSAKAGYPYYLQGKNASPEDGPTFFGHWQTVLDTLARLAEKELAGVPMDEADLQFLNKTADLHVDPYDGSRRYNGWYPKLHWRGGVSNDDVGLSKPVVSDIHTDAETGRVLQTAVGHPGLMIIAVDNNGDLTLYGGPVSNYYSFTKPIHRRMTDTQWKALLSRGSIPKKPAFTQKYWVPSHPTQSVPNKPDAVYLRHKRLVEGF